VKSKPPCVYHHEVLGIFRKGSTSTSGVATVSRFVQLLGDGSDGAVVLNGTNTYASFTTKSGNVYRLTRNVFATTIDIPAGCTLDTDRFWVFATTSITNAGTIQCILGATAATATAGGSWSGVSRITAQFGSAPGNSTGASGGGTSSSLGGVGGLGGAIGATTGGTQTQVTCLTTGLYNPFSPLPSNRPEFILGLMAGLTTPCGGASGNSGASVDSTHKGGGSGYGGPCIILSAPTITNSGAINAPGGDGATSASSTNGGGGGGGGGGWIVINTTAAWTNTGTTNVAGGLGGAGVGTGAAGVAGAVGTVTNYVWP
jgi:hypothetical protein